MKAHALSVALLAVALIGLTACTYDFPLTEKPTRPVDSRLIGDWVTYDQDEQKLISLVIRRLDDQAYAIAFDGDLYRVVHSDVGDAAFVSVQNLQPGDYHGKFAWCAWTLSADGSQLTLRTVQTTIVSSDLTDAAAARKIIAANLTNPALLGEPLVFAPRKR